jgi:hypothetical protein
MLSPTFLSVGITSLKLFTIMTMSSANGRLFSFTPSIVTLLLSQLSVNSLGDMVSPYLTPRSSGNMSLSFCSLITLSSCMYCGLDMCICSRCGISFEQLPASIVSNATSCIGERAGLWAYSFKLFFFTAVFLLFGMSFCMTHRLKRFCNSSVGCFHLTLFLRWLPHLLL